jgi:hypothetical protein
VSNFYELFFQDRAANMIANPSRNAVEQPTRSACPILLNARNLTRSAELSKSPILFISTSLFLKFSKIFQLILKEKF